MPATDHFILMCFGLSGNRMHKQPWYSALGIARGLTEHGIRLTLITDSDTPPRLDWADIQTISPFYLHEQPTKALRKTLKELAPGRILIVGGCHELLYPERFHLPAPVSLILANPQFGWHEIRRLPLQYWKREWDWLKRPLLQSLLPGFLLRRGLLRSRVNHLITFSDAACEHYAEAQLPPPAVIPPEINLLLPPTQSQPVDTPLFGYYGPPFSFRGVRDVIEAFTQLRERGVAARLRLVIRADSEEEKALATALKQEVEKNPYVSDIEWHGDSLTPEALSAMVGEADIYVLPFYLTISDVPLTPLEAATSGKPVITYDMPGISEWADRFPNLHLVTPATLYGAMRHSHEYQTILPNALQDWRSVTAPFVHARQHAGQCAPLGHYRLICFIGADGVGKTTLASALCERLGLLNLPTRYVWSRFRNYLSRPFLALMRLTGHNRKIRQEDGTVTGIHNFRSNRLLGSAFLLLQKFDCLIDIFLRYRLQPSQVRIIADRCALDTLVDVTIATGRDDIITGSHGSTLHQLLPEPALIVLVERDEEAIRKARPDGEHDPHLAHRLDLYRRLAERFHLPVIHNNSSVDEALQEICTRIKL